MTDQELDQLMRRVLLDVAAKNEQKENPIQEFHASRQYQHEIQKMLRDPLSWAKRRDRPVWKRWMQRVAAVFLAVFIGLGGAMVISPTVRAAVIQWVTEWYETHIVYRYSGEDIQGEMPQYGITALPNGYQEIGKDIGPASVSVAYENEDHDLIFLDYTFMEEGAANLIVTEGFQAEDILINDYEGTLFMPDDPQDMSTLTWIDPEENIQFALNASLSKNAILYMAEEVSLVESTK